MAEGLLDVIDIAHVCHEANRALQVIADDPTPSPAWDEAPEWQRVSAIAGVVEAQNGATPEELHTKWCEYKRGQGWTYGPEKSEATLTHPCLVPYEELPEEQRIKDALFNAVVNALS